MYYKETKPQFLKKRLMCWMHQSTVLLQFVKKYFCCCCCCSDCSPKYCVPFFLFTTTSLREIHAWKCRKTATCPCWRHDLLFMCVLVFFLLYALLMLQHLFYILYSVFFPLAFWGQWPPAGAELLQGPKLLGGP